MLRTIKVIIYWIATVLTIEFLGVTTYDTLENTNTIMVTGYSTGN